MVSKAAERSRWRRHEVPDVQKKNLQLKGLNRDTIRYDTTEESSESTGGDLRIIILIIIFN